MPTRPAVFPPQLLDGPFTSAEATAAGLGRGVLRGRSVRRLARGLYVVAATPTLSFRATVQAALMVLPPDALATGVTALRLYGVEVGRARPLCFCTTSIFHTQRRGFRVARVTRRPAADGFAVAPELAFLAAVQVLNLVELVTAGDWLVRRKLTTPERLVRYAQAATGRGVRPARRAAALVRARVDSPKESQLRLMLVLAGLPEPHCNRGIGTDDYFIGHGDLGRIARALH